MMDDFWDSGPIPFLLAYVCLVPMLSSAFCCALIDIALYGYISAGEYQARSMEA
jgi:hypothetical protein